MTVARPSFARDAGPLVAVDSGHFNYHTIDGLYGPFAALLRNDGFRVVDSRTPFTADSLATINVLVISNALPSANLETLSSPTPSAFTAAEVQTLKEWVAEGGSLLLITDHQPLAHAASRTRARLRIPPRGRSRTTVSANRAAERKRTGLLHARRWIIGG